MKVGREDTIQCLQDIDLQAPDGQALCLAHKFSVVNVVGPIYLSDDGYVLKVRDANAYYSLTQAQIGELQASGQLPTPLPAYSISVLDYALGYGLWPILAVAIGVVVAAFRARRWQGPAVQPPVSTDGPALRTKSDHYIAAQTKQQLRVHEKVSHQALALSADVELAMFNPGLKSHFAVLTDERLILIETRVGMFGVKLENRSVEVIKRSTIVKADLLGRTLRLQMKDTSTRELVIPPDVPGFSNQQVFLRDVPRLLEQAPLSTEGRATPRS